MPEFATLNGSRIVGGSICLPYYGTWVADISLASADPISSDCKIVFGNLNLSGSIIRSAGFSGTRTVRLVGGKGGLRKPVNEQAYYSSNGVKISTVLRDVCGIVGEQITIYQDRTVGSIFVREKTDSAERILRQILGDAWWVDELGVIQTKPRASTQVKTDFTISSYSGGKGKFDIATEDPASWVPGRTFKNFNLDTLQTISTVNISLGEKSRLEILVTDA